MVHRSSPDQHPQQATPTTTTIISSSKDKSSEKGGSSWQSSKQLPASGSSGKRGPIQTSLEIVRQSCASGRAPPEEATIATKRHPDKSCMHYHDDYEYSYGLVQSNSDTDNDYCFGTGDDSAETSSILKEELDMFYGDDSSQKDASTAIQSTNLGLLTCQQHHAELQSSPMLTSTTLAAVERDLGFTSQRSEQQHPHHHHYYHQDQTTASVAIDKRRKGSSKHTRISTVGHHTLSRSQSGAGLPLKEHRINSVAVIAATLTAGGAIVDSWGSSSGTETAVSGVRRQEPAQPENEPSTQHQCEKQDEHISCLTTL